MDHWFDAFTKRLALARPSRRTVITAAAAALASAAAGTGWRRALAEPAAIRTRGGAIHPPAAKTITLGACTATSSGLAYKHQLTSRTFAQGKALLFRTTRTFDSQKTTLRSTLLIDGTPQVRITTLYGTPSPSYKLAVGNAFGVSGAVLISNDGKTLRGEIDRRPIVPYTKGSNAKLQFADGRPLISRPPPGLGALLRPAFAMAQNDLRLCGPHARAAAVPAVARAGIHERRQTAFAGTPGDGSLPISSINTNALLSPGCTACVNACEVSLVAVGDDIIECIAAFFGRGSLGACFNATVRRPDQQEECLRKCNADRACLGQPCLGTAGATSVSAIATCGTGDVCVGNSGYCCPASHPRVCPGVFNLNDPSYRSGYYGRGSDYANNICCRADAACVHDALAGTLTCCPQERVCGRNDGVCCPRGHVCRSGACVAI